MFTEREQVFLKGIAVSMLQVQQHKDFSSLEAPEIVDIFNNCLDDYFSHKPLRDCEDNR